MYHLKLYEYVLNITMKYGKRETRLLKYPLHTPKRLKSTLG